MTFRIFSLLLLVAATVGTAVADQDADNMRVDRKTLAEGDNTLVVQIRIEAPRSRSAEMTTLDFRWYDQTSTTISNGMWDESDETRRATLLIVAQIAKATGKHPAMLMISTQQESEGKAMTFYAYNMDEDAVMGDVLTVDIASGDYDVSKPLQIGTLGGKPIVLSLEPFPIDEAE